MSARCLPRTALALLLVAAASARILGDDAPAKPPAKPAKKPAMIAGKAEVLRAMPKRYAKLVAVDPARRQVTLLVEGENLAKVWSLNPDAEVKVNGWWGRLDQFKPNDRVWVWFSIDRAKQPTGILMLCDELSEQDVHRFGLTVAERTDDLLTLKTAVGKTLSFKPGAKEMERGKAKAPYVSLKAGEKVYVQTDAGRARAILDRDAFELRRAAQKAELRQRWLKQGLPGTVIFLHLSGEMEVMLDHEAMRWGRSLKPGDRVTLATARPIDAEVQQVRPWRERTQVRLVVGGFDEADLRLGQRIGLRMAAPPTEVENALLPPDLGRPRGKDERVDWFLASVYCPCGVKGDGCTGNFYTLASCNPNACGMPLYFRQQVAQRIDKGLTDKQIFEELLKEYGEDLLLRPHLEP